MSTLPVFNPQTGASDTVIVLNSNDSTTTVQLLNGDEAIVNTRPTFRMGYYGHFIQSVPLDSNMQA